MDDCPFQPREYTIHAIKWPDDDTDRVEIRCEGGSMVCAMAKEKDLFRNKDRNWRESLTPGGRLRLWTISWSRVLFIEWWDGASWLSVWCQGNDFQTKAEEEARSKAYDQFCRSQAALIAGMIDEGKDLAAIEAGVDPGHSGFTMGWAMHHGIGRAERRENAELVRLAWNERHGVTEGEGTVNPAVLTVKGGGS